MEIVVARVVVVQPREPIVVLPRKALVGTQTPLFEPLIAIGPVELVAQHHRPAGQIVEVGYHTSQGVGEQEEGGGGTAIPGAQQLTCQGVVVGIAGVGGTAARALVSVLVLL